MLLQDESPGAPLVDVNTILDLLTLTPNVAVLVCDANGLIKGGSPEVRRFLQQETEQVTGIDFLNLLSAPSLHGATSFTSFAKLAQNGVSVQLDLPMAPDVVVRVRDAGGEGNVFAVSLEQAIVSSPAAGDDSGSQPDVLLSVAEEIADFGCFSWDMAEDRLEWSDGLFTIFGIDRSQFSSKGEAFFSRIHPDDQDGIRESLAAAIGNGGRFESAERIIRSNGELRWLESLGRLETDADGNPRQLRGVCRDITDIRHNAQELKRQVQALEQLTECAATMFSQNRSEGDWATLLLQLGQIVGADVLKHCVLSEGKLSSTAFEQASQGTSGAAERISVLKHLSDRCVAGGRDLYCFSDDPEAGAFGHELRSRGLHCCYAIPLFSEGNCIGTLAFASTSGGFSSADRYFLKLVAEVVCAAHTRKLLERFCEREKLRYQDAVLHAKMVVWELDVNMNCFTFVSASCEALTGFKPEEWYEPEFWEQHIYSDDREASVAFCRNATENKKDHRFEYRMITKDGRVIWIDDIVQVVLQDGDVVGLRGTLIDITERKSLEQQLLQAQKMEAIGNLTSGIAHDFNNLLTVIVSSSELLQLQPSDILADDARDLVHAIQDAADRACQLTDQLLLFSRSTTPQRQSVDLNAAIVESREFLGRVLGSENQFSVNLQSELPSVRTDPTHLQQILLNLTVNARDAMPEGGRLIIQTSMTTRSHSQVPSHVRSAGVGDFAVLSVSDTGVGVPGELQSRIFDPFFTTKPVGSGTGLGLSVVYGIVHEAGGFIEVDSEVGAGTEFRIYFPTMTAELSSPDNEVAALPAERKTILIVEDDPAVMRVTMKTFQQAGYHVIGIPDPAEALRFVANSQQPVHLLVTDVSMPTLSGPDLVKSMQGDALALPFPVLFISGSDPHVLKTSHGIAADADNFIQKPFRISTLIKKAQQLLSSHLR